MSTPVRQRVLDAARAAGFDAAGIAPVAVGPREQARLDGFLAGGEHGDMDWMLRTAQRRRDPARLWPPARSVVVVAANYGPARPPLGDLAHRERGNISVYARNRDYHDIMKKRLKRLGRWMSETFGCEARVFVDTAPVLEKPLARAAGIGWQGKHTNLVSREFGSWLFLGEVFTSLELEPDTPTPDHCGTCRRCLDICPTDAFPTPYTLDARRCISYLTIEHKGHIAREFRIPMGNRIFGCDDCLAVCPWNRFARTAREAGFIARDDLDLPELAPLLELDDAAFRARFSGSPVKRLGRDRFLRNVLIAVANADGPLPGRVIGLLDDPSPLVRAMAVWALGRLAPPEQFAALRKARMPGEPDPQVRHEWTHTLGGDGHGHRDLSPARPRPGRLDGGLP